MSVSKVIIGDLFQSSAQTLVNTVNCVGVMGKGIAEEFKKKFPEMFLSYKKECEMGTIKTGELRLYSQMFGKSVLNFPTKKHWKSPSLLSDIEQGLDFFLAHYKEWGIESVAFPPLGCGNGGLSWEAVGPLMYKKLSTLDIPVEIYAPFGTAPEKLKESFLMQENNSSQKKGILPAQKITAGNFATLEVVYRLSQQKYVKPIGRTIFQKICYVLTDLSVDTKFSFSKSSYGPFSNDIKPILGIFANANLMKEESDGLMMKMQIGENFFLMKENFKDDLQKWENQIAKTVDLFSRIKDTNQAEKVATVIFAERTLKKNKSIVFFDELKSYLFEWKDHWKFSSEAQKVEEAIYNLSALGWITVDFSKKSMKKY